MLLHREYAWCVVQLLRDVLADAFELATTAAGGGVGFVVDVHAGKACGQRSTFGLLAGLAWGLCNRCQRFEFLLDGGNIGINRLVDQADLRPIELLA